MKKLYKIIFIVSFIPIIISLIYSVWHMIIGIDTGIVCITSPCPTHINGIKAFVYCFYKSSNIFTYALCFVYQMVYIFKLRKDK